MNSWFPYWLQPCWKVGGRPLNQLENGGESDYFLRNKLRRFLICLFLNIPVWTVVRIFRPLSLNPPSPFSVLNVKQTTARKKCPPLLSKDRIVSSEQAVLPVVELVLLITVPLVINRAMKEATLRHCPLSSSLRRTLLYVFLGISGALHLDLFDYPVIGFLEPIINKISLFNADKNH